MDDAAPEESTLLSDEQRLKLIGLIGLIYGHHSNLLRYVASRVPSTAAADRILGYVYRRALSLADTQRTPDSPEYLYTSADEFIRLQEIGVALRLGMASRKKRSVAGSSQFVKLNEAQSRRLSRAIGELSPKLKMALLLVKQDGLSYEEAGAKLGMSPEKAELLMVRAAEYLFEKVPLEYLGARDTILRQDRTYSRALRKRVGNRLGRLRVKAV